MAQQSVATARRVSDSEPRDGVLIQPAVLQIGPRCFSFQRPFELLHKKSLRLAVHLNQQGSLLILFALLGRALLLPGNGDPALLRHDANRFGKCALLHFHHKLENVPAHAASEAVINLFRRMHRERRRFFRMEGTQPGKILPAFFQADVFADNPDDVRLLLYPIRK